MSNLGAAFKKKKREVRIGWKRTKAQAACPAKQKKTKKEKKWERNEEHCEPGWKVTGV